MCKRNEKVNCLITGSTGLIGRHILQRQDENIFLNYIVRKKELMIKEKCKDNQLPIFCDLSKQMKLPEIADLDAIIHCAHSREYHRFDNCAQDIFDVNIKATFDLLEYGKKMKIKNFIFISTGGVYKTSTKPLTESSQLIEKRGFYTNSKRCGEILSNSYKDYFNVIILRLFFPYGKGQNKENLFPRLIQNIINRETIYLNGSEGMMLNPIYAGDVAEAIIKTTRLNSSEIINIGGNKNLTLRSICEIIGQKLEVPVRFKRDDNNNNDLFCDTSLMTTLLLKKTSEFETKIDLML